MSTSCALGVPCPAGVLLNMIAHSNEMYGTSGVYLRAKGRETA